jgi:two-component system, chemotaxis family, protein-glutamate methylesterase/glutaminase
LGAILPQLPADFPLAGPGGAAHAASLHAVARRASSLRAGCRSKKQARAIRWIAGKILIAPGDFHLKVASNGGGVRVCLDQSPPQNSCRPAVDALFASIGRCMAARSSPSF